MRHHIARRMNSMIYYHQKGFPISSKMRTNDSFRVRPRTSSTLVVQAKAKGQGDMKGQKGTRAPRGHKRSASSTPAAMVGEIYVPDATPVAHLLTSRYRALVLDASYRPIDIVNWQRAIVLDLLQKADVLEYYDYTVSSVSEQFFVPAVIKAKRQRGKHLGRFGRVPLNRKNIMLRDGLKCQYCGKRGGSNLTLDHVIPQSKGGPNTWQNLVTACGPCNTRKGDSTLRELRWKLLSQPKEPSPWDMGIILASLGMSDLESVPEEWSTYLFSSGSDTD